MTAIIIRCSSSALEELSRLGLESSGCSMWHFLKLVARGFLWVLRFPPLLHPFNGSANTIKLKINAISTLSNLIAELSLRTKWHVTWHLHVISARCVARDLHTIAPGHLSVRVGDSSRRCEEIVKNLEQRLWMRLLLLLLLISVRPLHPFP